MAEYPGGLDDQLKDVPDSSTEDDYEDDIELENDDLEAESVDQNDDPGQDDDKEKDESGRDINNVYREFARKQEEFQERMQKQHNVEMRELTAALRNQPAQPAQQDGGSLDSTSIDQLKNMRPNVPEEQRVAFDDYLQDRVIKAETDKRMSEFSRNQNFDSKRKDANHLAVDRYPELKDSGSDFHVRVDEELRSRGKDYMSTNPNAVLDVANTVAIDMGLTAKPTNNRHRRIAPAPANRRHARPVEPKEKDTISDEKVQSLAEHYRANIPGLKLDTKDIKKNHKLYSDNKDLFTK